ncbi:MAG: hypothetical protein QCH31_11225 [Methanolobus sp.]|nr:hypothetical protein [Methanolobus sp.]
MVHLSAINNELETNPISLIAAAGLRRKDLSIKISGYHNFNIENRFRYYQQLSSCTPQVSTSMNKLGLSLVRNAV